MFIIESIAESIFVRTLFALAAIAQAVMGWKSANEFTVIEAICLRILYLIEAIARAVVEMMDFERLEAFVASHHNSFIGHIANIELTQRDEYLLRFVTKDELDSLYSDPE